MNVASVCPESTHSLECLVASSRRSCATGHSEVIDYTWAAQLDPISVLELQY